MLVITSGRPFLCHSLCPHKPGKPSLDRNTWLKPHLTFFILIILRHDKKNYIAFISLHFCHTHFCRGDAILLSIGAGVTRVRDGLWSGRFFQFFSMLRRSVRSIHIYGFVFGIASLGWIYEVRSNGSKGAEVSWLLMPVTISFCRMILYPCHKYIIKIFL